MCVCVCVCIGSKLSKNEETVDHRISFSVNIDNKMKQ